MARAHPTIAICAAFYAGHELIQFVLKQPYRVAFVATSHRDDSEYEEKIARLCESHGVPCFRKIDANSPAFLQTLKSQQIDLVFLLWWPSIIKPPAIKAVNKGWVNLHPSFLPYNQGKHPYYWAIVEGTPFGVTIHYINEHVDRGDILFQKEIPVEVTDTGESLYAKGMTEIIALFKRSYPKLATGEYTPKTQDQSHATFHLAKDITEHSRIDLDKAYTARELINIIRARTFLKGDSAYFDEQGKRYRIKVILEEVKPS